MAADGGGWSAYAADCLQAAGHRWGSARLAVVEVLARQDCCLTAREIVDELRGQGRPAGTASVYRALELLLELGLVIRLEVGDGTARYEAAQPSGEHHHHLVCARCGRVTAFADDALERALDRVADRVDHAVDAHDVVLRGTCAPCRAGA